MREGESSPLLAGRCTALAAALCVVLASTVTAASTSTIGAVANPVAQLTCRASVPATLRGAQAAVLTLQLHNHGRRPLYVLRRNTPMEGWLADSLTVLRDGANVPYTGAMAKRTPPQPAEYLVLKPGQRYRYRARIAPAYDVAPAGRYHLQWRGEIMDVRSDVRPTAGAELHPVTLTCPAVEFVRTPE